MIMERGLHVPPKYSWAEMRMPRTVDSRLRSSNFAQARSLTPMFCSSAFMYVLPPGPSYIFNSGPKKGYFQSLWAILQTKAEACKIPNQKRPQGCLI